MLHRTLDTTEAAFLFVSRKARVEPGRSVRAAVMRGRKIGGGSIGGLSNGHLRDVSRDETPIVQIALTGCLPQLDNDDTIMRFRESIDNIHLYRTIWRALYLKLLGRRKV